MCVPPIQSGTKKGIGRVPAGAHFIGARRQEERTSGAYIWARIEKAVNDGGKTIKRAARASDGASDRLRAGATGHRRF